MDEIKPMVGKIILFIKGLNEKQTLLVLIGITFGLRLYAVLMAKGIPYDGASYGFMARDFIKGDFIKGLSSALHPFYPFLISLFSPDTAHVEIVGRLISLTFGTLTLIPVFYLVKEVMGQKEAIFSGLLYSFHPYLVTYSGMLLSEATYWGLLTLSVYFFWVGLKRGKIFRLAASGIFLALAYLTRPEGIGYLFVYLIWAIFYGGFKKGWFKIFSFIGTLILPIFILSASYIIYIHQETGQLLISKKAMVIQSKIIGGNEKEEGQSITKMYGIAKDVAQYIPFTTYHFLRAYHFTLWIFLFFGLIRVRQKFIAYELFLASLVLFHLVSLSTFIPSTIRFSVPVIPLSLFWVGAGILEMKRYLEKIKISYPEKVIILFILLVILVQLPQSLTPERRHRAEQKKIGLWLKQNTPLDAIIMSNSPQETFYANREFIFLPLGISTPEHPGKSYKEIIHFAKQKKVRYILVNNNTSETNPDFAKSIRESDLREFYKFKRKDSDMVIVYEVVY